jgi:hypothetical protein
MTFLDYMAAMMAWTATTIIFRAKLCRLVLNMPLDPGSKITNQFLRLHAFGKSFYIARRAFREHKSHVHLGAQFVGALQQACLTCLPVKEYSEPMEGIFNLSRFSRWISSGI